MANCVFTSVHKKENQEARRKRARELMTRERDIETL